MAKKNQPRCSHQDRADEMITIADKTVPRYWIAKAVQRRFKIPKIPAFAMTWFLEKCGNPDVKVPIDLKQLAEEIDWDIYPLRYSSKLLREKEVLRRHKSGRKYPRHCYSFPEFVFKKVLRYISMALKLQARGVPIARKRKSKQKKR